VQRGLLKTMSPSLNPNKCEELRQIHFVVMAVESAARKMGISGQEMYSRLKAQNLIHNRLLARYEDLHTQSREWVTDDIIETLQNWEAGV